MPLEDAINLVTGTFNKNKREGSTGLDNSTKQLLNFVLDGRVLSVGQYDQLISFLSAERDKVSRDYNNRGMRGGSGGGDPYRDGRDRSRDPPSRNPYENFPSQPGNPGKLIFFNIIFHHISHS